WRVAIGSDIGAAPRSLAFIVTGFLTRSLGASLALTLSAFLRLQPLFQLVERLLRLLLARRLSVEAEAVFHERDAAALLRLADDRGRLAQRAAAPERLDDRAHVVPVDLDRVPAEGLELGADVAGVHHFLGGPVGLKVVVVDDRGQVRDVEM